MLDMDEILYEVEQEVTKALYRHNFEQTNVERLISIMVHGVLARAGIRHPKVKVTIDKGEMLIQTETPPDQPDIEDIVFKQY